MTEYSDAIQQTFSAAPRAVIGSVDDNPDEAARAQELSKNTGVPAPVIYGDLEGFERQHRATLAADIVRNNPHLQDYINSNPMAAKLSNDDYGNLDAASQSASTLSRLLDLPRTAVNAAAREAWEKAKEGWGTAGSGLSDSDLKNHRLLSAMYLSVEPIFRAVSATFAGTVGAVKGGATEVGGEKFGKDIGGAAEMQLMGGGAHGVHVPDAVRIAKPWLEQGKEPPAGLHPEIDKLKAERNAQGVDALDQAMKDAQASATLERDPDMFADFMRQHLGESKIGISGDAIAKLYGDKVPVPDDGILGWVPGIEAQLEAAKATGADIQVPVADWLAKADPKLAKELHDDIRIQPGDITAREVAEQPEPTQPKPLVESPLAATRGAASLEPLYSIGDRKLSLKKITSVWGDEFIGRDPKELAAESGDVWEHLAPYERQRYIDASQGKQKTVFGPEQGFHDFNLIDETGRTVGQVNLSMQKGGKQVYVDGITGVNGLGPRDFGPSLMRDLLRQIKAEFPQAETITGHRVSGARDVADSYMKPSAMPVVKLDVPEGWDRIDGQIEQFRQALQEQHWRRLVGKLEANIKPTDLFTKHEKELSEAVRSELARIAPTAESIPAAGLRDKGFKGNVRGAYLQYSERNPAIVWSLTANDPVGTARHEAIHHLRQSGFFTNAEWKTLSEAAQSEGWDYRYGINKRYEHLSPEARLEEAVAEGFRDWASSKDSLKNKALDLIRGESSVAKVFRKLQEFLDAIKEKFKAILGHEPTWEELFGKVSEGEIGSREGAVPLNSEAYRLSIEDKQDQIRANATGLDIASFKRLQKLIEQRHEEDVSAAMKRAEAEQRRTQTKEWKDQRAALRTEVEADIKQRPDVAADLFFGSGELYGKDLGKRYRLATDDLTPEQREALPKHYQAKNGIPPDEAAKMFGYGSGDALIEKLAEYNKAKGDLTPNEFLKKVIDTETDRRMEAQHGLLEKNIMEEAKDQAVSETQLNLLAEEMHAVGMKAGVETINADVAKAWVWDKFKNLSIGDINSDRFLKDVGRHGRDAERMLIAEQPTEALQSLQKKYLSALFANHARKLERDMDRFDTKAKRLSVREIKSIEPEYLNFIHQVLLQVGKPIRRSIQDLAEAIEASGHKNLEEFVATKKASLREMPVAPFFYDTNFRKAYAALTVDEFNAASDSVKALEHNGRDELKIYRAGEAADFNDKKAEMIAQLEEFQLKNYDSKGGRWMGPLPPAIAKKIRTYGAAHMQIENLFNRWDHFKRDGVWNQFVMRDLVEGANQEDAFKKEYAKKLLATDDKADLKKSVDNPLFKDPYGGQPLQLNRGNLRAILLNAGNESNLAKLAGGYKLKPEQVMEWLGKHATKEDWEWAQKIGDIFKDIKTRADTMYRSMTGGVAPEALEIKPIDTAHGKYDGWYYPIIYHPEFEGSSKKLMGGDPLEQNNYIRATTSAGYTKGRTGYQAPMALDLDMLPGRISQMLHDVSLRPAVLNAAKVMYDKDIRGKIAAHFGSEYRDLLVPYLRDVANSTNYMAKAQKEFTQWSEFIRQNMISTLVGLNPGTVMKHGPTALVQSLHEVGAVDFLKAVKGLFSINEATGENNWQFAMKNSQELQRRGRNYQETLSGVISELVPSSKFMTLRETVLKYASMPVAISDLISAVPTWSAQYTKSITENGGIHGDAVFDADRAVRRAHGSTAITNRPGVMRTGPLGSWFASVYGFFNHIMNRQAELVWKSGDALGLVKQGEYKEAMGKVPELSAMLFAYVLAPALIEEMVTPLASDDKESWGKKAAKGVAFTLGASWIGVRDVASAILNGRDPSVGLLSTGYKTVSDVARDYGKDRPLSKDHAGKIIKDATTLFGTATGLAPAQVGRVAQFGYNVSQGIEKPKGPWGWMVGLRYGTTEKHSKTFDEWMKHH